ncbi:monocarboxylate transporter 12-like isoform X1 [Centruroides vittatus]|uniref:monocarboxylate transporter 12-like isoform X1 n=2 Tax=Centruroides vittatus TaxID=120091 RepID=UPI003510B94A
MMIKVDEGRAWVIAFSTFWTFLTVLAIQRCSGVLFRSMMNVYNVSRESAAWPFYLRKTVGFLSANLVGFINAYFSMKCQMFVGLLLSAVAMSALYFVDDILSITLIFGILYGVGSGIVMMCNLISINKFFSKYRTVAQGISLAGNSTGAFILPPLIEYFIDNYGLRGTYLMLTGVVLQGFIVVMMYEDSPYQKPENLTELSISESIERNLKQRPPSKESDTKISKRLIKTCLYIFKCPMYHVIWITYATFDFVFQTFLTVIIDHGADCGINEHKAVYFLSALSVVELIGRLGGGWIVDLQLIKRKNIIRISFMFYAMIYISLPFLRTYVVMIVLTATIGLIGSSVAINGSSLFADYVGLENLPMALGFSASLTGLIGLITPRILGHIRDTTGSYNLLFFIFGAASLFVTLMWIAEPLFMRLQLKIHGKPYTINYA